MPTRCSERLTALIFTVIDLEAVVMKKFLSAALIALIVTFSANICAANSWSVPITRLEHFVGTWYDSKGNLILTISKDYKINGCTVLATYGVDYFRPVFFNEGNLLCKIDEGNSPRDIYLDDYFIENKDYHDMIVLNGKMILRRTKEPRYVESIGGIYLGMGQDEVLRLYGQPSSVINDGLRTWKYNQQKFDVQFYADVVHKIIIHKGGDRCFDWSGLSANSSKAEFEHKYNGTFDSRNRINIGHCERIRLEGDAVSLELLGFGI